MCLRCIRVVGGRRECGSGWTEYRQMQLRFENCRRRCLFQYDVVLRYWRGCMCRAHKNLGSTDITSSARYIGNFPQILPILRRYHCAIVP